jgi:ABC-type sugar transport system ATPase subunit
VAGFLNRHVGTPPISFIDGGHLAHDPSLAGTRVGVRPEAVSVSRAARPGGLRGTVVGRLSLPMLNATIVSARVGEHEIYAQAAGDLSVSAGEEVWLSFRQYHVFERESGARLRSVAAEGAPA